MTNILALPLAQMAITTGNNEDMVESVLFQVGGTGSASLGIPADQLDLRGIDFTMYVRRRPSDHEVILVISSDNRGMAIGAFPNIGFLLFYCPLEEIKYLLPGNYVADVVATDGEYERRTLIIDLTIVQGITRQ